MLIEDVRGTLGRKEHERSNSSSDEQVTDVWIIWSPAAQQHTKLSQENSRQGGSKYDVNGE